MFRIYGQVPTRAFRALWLLEELEAPYEMITVDLAQRENRREEFLRLNPAGKLPVLEHNGLILLESAAILNYIGSCFPDSNLVPESRDPKRPIYDQWMFFSVTELEHAVWNFSKHRFALPAAYRLWQMEDVARYEFDQAEAVLAAHLDGNKFLLGDSFSAVDIMASQILMWASRYNLVTRPSTIEYRDRLRERAAYHRVGQKFGKK